MPMIPGRIYTRSTVYINGTFRNEDDELVDPDTLIFEVIAPDGTLTTATLGVDNEIEPVSTGKYNGLIQLNGLAGRWHWRWRATGAGVVESRASYSGSFPVQASVFECSTSDAYRDY